MWYRPNNTNDPDFIKRVAAYNLRAHKKLLRQLTAPTKRNRGVPSEHFRFTFEEGRATAVVHKAEQALLAAGAAPGQVRLARRLLTPQGVAP
jgi:hypothetical protein